MRSWIQRGAFLLLAFPLPALSAPEPAPQPAQGLEAGSVFAALNRCASTRQATACLDAEGALKGLIQLQEAPDQRQLHPRCLGALSQVETVLAVFRWRLETNDNLQRMIDAAQLQCPAGSAVVGQ